MMARSLRLCGAISIAAMTVMPLLGAGCGGSSDEEPGGAGAGGATGGGGQSGEPAPDYARMFPQDRVSRLDITLTAENWTLMVDDMTGLLGKFGEGGLLGPGGGGMGGMGGGVPQELIDACAGLVEGDSCEATFGGNKLAGTCRSMEGGDGTLLCQPAGGPGGPGGPGGSVDLLSKTPIYAECDVALDGQKLRHAGLRFKGNSSLATSWMGGIWKLPLRLTFDEFEDTYPETKDQRLFGFKALSLSNGSADGSLLRDKLGTDTFAAAGLPAPATAFYRVYIDHGGGPTYFGLYTAIELPSDKSFLEKAFGNHKGNLYKPDGTGAQWATWDTATLGKENNEEAADFSDAKALFDALHGDRTDAAAWRAGLEASLDVDGFLSWLALNTVVQDWDTYGRMSHNYYLYADKAKGGRLRWIPWDHSYAFSSQQALSLALSEVGEQWPLIRFLLDDPVYQESYRQKVGEAASKHLEPAAAEARFRAAHELIKPYVTGAEGEVAGYTFIKSPEAFEASLTELIEHAKSRQQQVAEFLK